MNAAWQVLETVLDPEVPALSVVDLGIVREVSESAEGLNVVLTPTYSGCPATEVIERDVRRALEAAAMGPVHIERRLAPAWTSDWISETGRAKLAAYGIAPPSGSAALLAEQPIHLHGRLRASLHAPLACTQCGSLRTERVSAFGSTACKALHRCLDCGEPFEHFKPI